MLQERVDEGDVGREVRLATVRQRLSHEERLAARGVRQPLQRQAYVVLMDRNILVNKLACGLELI